ncbi:hypothetical protein TrLO_g3587 [Triparma laevis f. longispina]|nr:hypothetical protein TrLO_g3587 [Triparma laevis f. longispina]
MTALISLLVSLLTTGFVSATMSYDFDTDPKKRAANPQFYGFVPDNQKVRAALFTIMALSSSVQVLLKGLLVALLGSMNLRYSLYYIVGDMVFYFVYKMARRDSRHWIPMTGIGGTVISGFLRVSIKFCVDFAGVVQFRHPFDLGGMYFTINMFLPLIGMSLLLCLDLLNVSDVAMLEDGIRVIVTDLTLALGTSVIVLVSLFFLLMNPDHRRTFYSVETGGQMTRRLFLEGDDAMKSEALTVHVSHWGPIEKKIRRWVGSGWEKWVSEKPDWFTDQWKAMVPADMIPSKRKHSNIGGVRDNDDDEEEDDDDGGDVVSPQRQQGRRKSVIAALLGGDSNELSFERNRKNSAQVMPMLKPAGLKRGATWGGGGESNNDNNNIKDIEREEIFGGGGAGGEHFDEAAYMRSIKSKRRGSIGEVI